MANVQLEHGFTKIANELLDAIQSFQFTQNQFKLLLALWRNTYGWNKKQCEFSLNRIIRQTGLQRKRVIETLKSLEENNVIIEVKAPVGSSPKVVQFNKNYATWTIKKYAGTEFSSGYGDTPRVGQNDTPTGSESHFSSGHADTPPVVAATPPSSGHGDTPRVGQNDTPINTKDILNTKDINTEAEKAAAVSDDPVEIHSTENQNNNAADPAEIYLRKLLNRFIELRGYGFSAKPADVDAAKEILAAGVPLQDAISSLEEAFKNYQPRHSRDRIHSLSYCVGYVLDRHFPAAKKVGYKKPTREEVAPDWFAKRQQEKQQPQENEPIDFDVEAERRKLLKELGM